MLLVIFVIISFIIYKKYYILNGKYMTRIMNILSLKKEEDVENRVVENNQSKNLQEGNYADSIS